ncbi:MAG: sulfatase, partial [Planctomycetaceae bacterium]
MPNRFLMLTLWLSVWCADAAAAGKNVLLLISDNHNWHDVGCYGNDIVKTPHIDRLAAEGVRFRNAFATTASCGPSRAVMYTGLLTHANGQYAHPHREHNQQLRDEVVSVFEMLKDNGYRTALIGKDHIRPLEKYPIDFKPSASSYDVVSMAQAAQIFLQDTSQPFFLVMSYHDPHPTSRDGSGWGIRRQTSGYEPVTYNPKSIPVPGFLPDTPDVRESLAGYYQQISRLDHGIGLMMKALRDSGQADQTLVIFYSDHGTSEPGAMANHYEPGVHVPFIVRKPGGPAGTVNDNMVAFTDLTPTILDWTNTTFQKYPLHGRSLLPILNTPTAEGWDKVLLSHVGHDVYANYPMRTLRERRYKLIWNVTWQAEYPLPIDTFERRLWSTVRRDALTHLGPRTVDAFLHRPIL